MLLVPVFAVALFVGLLDGISNLGAVWSVRKLVSTYAGSCLRIRRSSDNAEQDFGFSSNLVDASGIASFIGGGSGYIVTWYDQSGNGVDVTNATAANQPLFVASGIGSKPTLRFDGVDDQLSKASLAISTIANVDQWTFLFVEKQTSTHATAFSWSDGSGSNQVLVYATFSSNLYFDFGNGAGDGRVSVAKPGGWDGVPHVVEGYRTTGDVQAILVDGTSLVSSGSHNSGPSGTQNFVVASDGATRLGGDLSEMIALKDDTGSTNRATIRKDGVGSGVAQGMGPYYGVTVA